jgi:hypothetical protein
MSKKNIPRILIIRRLNFFFVNILYFPLMKYHLTMHNVLGTPWWCHHYKRNVILRPKQTINHVKYKATRQGQHHCRFIILVRRGLNLKNKRELIVTWYCSEFGNIVITFIANNMQNLEPTQHEQHAATQL